MSEVQLGPAPAPQFPAPEPVQPVKKKRKWILPICMLVGGMILGGSIGASNTPEPVVQTKVETVTKEVKVEVTPKECITALDLAATLVGDLSKVPGIAGDGMQAAFDRDVTAINAVTERLKTSKAALDKQTAPLGAAVAVCRASAK